MGRQSQLLIYSALDFERQGLNLTLARYIVLVLRTRNGEVRGGYNTTRTIRFDGLDLNSLIRRKVC